MEAKISVHVIHHPRRQLQKTGKFVEIHVNRCCVGIGVRSKEGQGFPDPGDIGLSYLSRQVISPDCVRSHEPSPLSSSSCRQGDKSLTSGDRSSKEPLKVKFSEIE